MSQSLLPGGPDGPAQEQPPKKVAGKKCHQADRTTTCEVCQKAFKTYHQLVLHSRVHKREKGGKQGPVSSTGGKQRRAAPPHLGKEGTEQGLRETLGLGEDGLDRPLSRSVHLRTDTSEKTYKCVFCDYASTRKASLKCHLDRLHKQQPATRMCLRLSVPSVLRRAEHNEPFPANEGLLKHPSPVHLEETDVKRKHSDAPLNPSRKRPLTIPARANSKIIGFPRSCSFCPFTTLYPAVLMMHQRLLHKDQPDNPKTSMLVGSSGLMPSTDCPPPPVDRRRRRQAKSPAPPAAKRAKPQKPPVKLCKGVRRPPAPPDPAPVQDAVQLSMPVRMNSDSQPSEESSTHTELLRRPGTDICCFMDAMDRIEPLGRVGNSVRSYLASLSHVKTDSSEKAGVRRSLTDDGPTRLLMTGTSLRTMPWGAALPPPSEILGARPPPRAGSDLLHPDSWSEQAAFHHSTPPNLSPAGLVPPRAADSAVLSRHLPCIPGLQRTDFSGSFPDQHHGTSDKSG